MVTLEQEQKNVYSSQLTTYIDIQEDIKFKQKSDERLIHLPDI